MTADLKVKTPDAMAERNDLSLPMKIERFPSSLQEIKNSIYGKTFSQLYNSFSKSCGNCNNFWDVKGGFSLLHIFVSVSLNNWYTKTILFGILKCQYNQILDIHF